MTRRYAPALRHAFLLSLLALAACKPKAPTADDFSAVLEKHFETHGELCIGRHHWPIDVPDTPQKATLRDGVQMDALEHAGLVSHEAATMTRQKRDGSEETLPALRYQLTDKGREFFREKPGIATVHGAGEPDLCYGKVRLDHVRDWTPVQQDAESKRNITTVRYLYVIDAAPWTKDEQVQRAFPVVARVVNGSGTMPLTQEMMQTDTGWAVR